MITRLSHCSYNWLFLIVYHRHKQLNNHSISKLSSSIEMELQVQLHWADSFLDTLLSYFATCCSHPLWELCLRKYRHWDLQRKKCAAVINCEQSCGYSVSASIDIEIYNEKFKRRSMKSKSWVFPETGMQEKLESSVGIKACSGRFRPCSWHGSVCNIYIMLQ